MKPCPYCLAEINENAKKCCHCGEWISFWRNSNVTSIIVLVIVFGSIFGAKVIVSNSATDYLEGKQFSNPVEERFKILNHSRIDDGNSSRIVGEIKNTGPSSKEFISVEILFFDKDNKTIDVGQDYLSGEIKANEVRPFKVSFGGCGTEKRTKTFDHYEVKIRN